MSPLTLLLLAGCPWISQDEAAEAEDLDGDGIPWFEDCDGRNPAVGRAAPWYADRDGDGHGDPDDAVVACDRPEGRAATGDDCDDDDAGAHPDAVETCDPGDDDCDGEVDENAVDASAWYLDRDGDGAGSAEETRVACDPPSGFAATDDDCDDADPGARPGLEEVCGDGIDNDCDGTPGVCTPLWGEVDLTVAEAVMWGSAAQRAGMTVAGGGDLDADGVPDLLVASAGYLYHVEGPLEGRQVLGDAARYVFNRTGTGVPALALPGDLDGDGFGDFVLGEPDVDGLGRVLVRFGPDEGMDGRTVVLEGDPDTHDPRAGQALAGGPVDEDGDPDLLVGAPGVHHGAYYAGAIYGLAAPAMEGASLLAPDIVVYGESGSGWFGTSLAVPGDMDGDGYHEIAVGAPGEGYDAGAVALFPGPLGVGVRMRGDAESTWTGEAVHDRAGQRVEAVGDIDGDGFADLLVVADPTTRLGAPIAWLVGGPSPEGTTSLADARARILAPDLVPQAGAGACGPGDLDDDGLDDLVLGAPDDARAGTGAGAVFLLYGPVAGTFDLSNAQAVITGEQPGDGLGGCTRAGDVDGDGVSDLLLAADRSDLGGVDAGAVYLLAGAVGF